MRKKEGGARNVQPTTTLTLRKGGERKGSDERTKITMTRVVTAAEMINDLFARYRSVEDRGNKRKERKKGRKKERKNGSNGGKSWKLYEIPQRLARYVFPRNILLIVDGFETDKISVSPSKISFLYKSINTSTSSFVEREQKYFLILKILIDEAVG